MPYNFPDNVPDYVKNLPDGAQRIFVDAFNEAIDRGDDEDTARQAGWGAVKNAYEKQGEEWVRKAAGMTLRYVSYIGEEPLSDRDGPQTSVIQVFRTGKFKHPVYGTFTITDEMLQVMVGNFKSRRPKPPTQMVVDYEHMGAMDPPQVSPAAGWVEALNAVPGKLLATVQWTEKAAEMIRAGEYKFISPEWSMNYKDKESGKAIGPCLLSIALTNRPFIEGMDPVMLSRMLEDSIMLSENVIAADWDTQYINDLPDEAFAYVAPGGEKDEQGKTVPRELRHLPYRNMDGSTNLDHLRNALARLDQTSLSEEAKAEARGVLEKAAEEAGVGEAGEDDTNKAQEDGLMEDQLRELLGLGPDDDIVAAVTALKEKADKAEQDKSDMEQAVQEANAAREKAEGNLLAREVEDDVNKAIADGLLLPKQKDWAVSIRAKDKSAFDAYLAVAPNVGPDSVIRGSDTHGDEDSVQLTEAEITAGKRLGVSKEELIEQKRRDATRQAG